MAALRDKGGIWFGWSGRVLEHEPGPPDVFSLGKMTYAVVDLSQRDYDEYYKGFANTTLWPLFHYRLDLTEFTRRNLTGLSFAGKLPLIPSPWPSNSARPAAISGLDSSHVPWPALELLAEP